MKRRVLGQVRPRKPDENKPESRRPPAPPPPPPPPSVSRRSSSSGRRSSWKNVNALHTLSANKTTAEGVTVIGEVEEWKRKKFDYGPLQEQELLGQLGSSTEIPLCPAIPPDLVGELQVEKTSPTLSVQETGHVELTPGGHFIPYECEPRHKVALIIPFRNREEHLSVFLYHIHPILQRQQLDYTIFVVEQSTSRRKFNRGMLMNVGAQEALRQYPYNCFIFHDVDLLPENDRNLYTCSDQPRHMSVAVDVFKYKLPYEDIFGGVSAMSVRQFEAVNGFSNKFWGWGGEDDDMHNRIHNAGYLISRYASRVGRYTMLTHKKERPNPRR
ncbi:hypothetical protein Pmani_038795 [Petrolisthes manimaculis]|uniref:Beta-1,4-N-acetylgalactosaminyltransferase n=1 Tax=Petrolisthes manimaculis TaxID=1843537 RepID=A0AAE1NEY6_9EUCA|nr:hypothetical protein Pmani_038795 [Petrolisthes manimaculis]